MLYKKRMLYLLIFAVLLFGCAKKATDPPASNDQKSETTTITDVSSYFPAERNHFWEYEGSGNEYASFTRKVLYQKDDLVEITENNGGTVMGMVFKKSSKEIVQIFSTPEFYEERNILDAEPNLQKVILKSPLKAGATWQDSDYKREVVSINEKIEVPAGEFTHVVKIKVTLLDEISPESENYEYYAKDVGLVMREFISGDMTVTSQLKSFEKNHAE